MKTFPAFKLLIAATTILSTLNTYAQIGDKSDNNKERFANGMVVCAYPDAAQVGVDIMKKGGNAVDAAVAVQFALAVTWPDAGNIGGGGFFVFRFAKSENKKLCF